MVFHEDCHRINLQKLRVFNRSTCLRYVSKITPYYAFYFSSPPTSKLSPISFVENGIHFPPIPNKILQLTKQLCLVIPCTGFAIVLESEVLSCLNLPHCKTFPINTSDIRYYRRCCLDILRFDPVGHMHGDRHLNARQR